jgi:hypothetical protein
VIKGGGLSVKAKAEDDPFLKARCPSVPLFRSGALGHPSVEYKTILGLFIFQVDSRELIQPGLGEEDAVRFFGPTGGNIDGQRATSRRTA